MLVATLGPAATFVAAATPPAASEPDAAEAEPTESAAAEAQEPEEPKPDWGFYGFIHLDTIYDFDRLNPLWNDTLRPSQIALSEEEFGSYGETIVSVRPSIFGMRGDYPTSNGKSIHGRFEFDLYGVGNNAGETTFHLRYVYLEYGSLMAGQHESTFMDVSIFPKIMEYWGPVGMVFNRNPQLRYTKKFDDSHFAVAIEKPNTSLSGGEFRQIAPDFEDRVRPKSNLPDLTAHYRGVHDWGHFQISGVLRQLAFETVDTPNNEPKDELTGWGLSLSASINTIGEDRVALQVTYGDGIGSYINDGGTNIAPEGPSLDNAQGEAVPLLSWVAFYDHYWNEKWSTSIGWSRLDMDSRSLQSAEEYDTGDYAVINLLHYPIERLTVGVEGTYGRKETIDGTTGDSVRVKLSVQYRLNAPW